MERESVMKNLLLSFLILFGVSVVTFITQASGVPEAGTGGMSSGIMALGHDQKCDNCAAAGGRVSDTRQNTICSNLWAYPDGEVPAECTSRGSTSPSGSRPGTDSPSR